MTLTVRPRTIFKTKRHNMGLMSEHVEHGFGPVWDGESPGFDFGIDAESEIPSGGVLLYASTEPVLAGDAGAVCQLR